MTTSALLLKNIERLGREYCSKYLDSEWDRGKLESDWFEALKFFFSHSFMRGRRDELSEEYYFFAIHRLQYDILDIDGEGDSYRRLQDQADQFDKDALLSFKERHGLRSSASKHPRFDEEISKRHEVIRLLTTPKEVEVGWGKTKYKKKIKLGNDEDVLMILDTLKFISIEERRNIYTYLRSVIKDYGISKAYNELTGLRAVGDKIATFVIRDIGLMNEGLIQDNFERAFPVDTWVWKLAKKFGCTTMTEVGIQEYFIGQCVEASVNPLLFAAGLWYLGSKSLDVLLDHYLGKYQIDGNSSAEWADALGGSS